MEPCSTRQALGNKLNDLLSEVEFIHQQYIGWITSNEDRSLLAIEGKLHNLVMNLIDGKETD